MRFGPLDTETSSFQERGFVLLWLFELGARGLPDVEEHRLAALPERGMEVQVRAVKREGRFPVEKWAVDYRAALRFQRGLAWRARNTAIRIRRRAGPVGDKIHRQAIAVDRGSLVVVRTADFENQLSWAECSVRLQRAGINVHTSDARAIRTKVQCGDPGHLIFEDKWTRLPEARIDSSADVYRLLPTTRAEILAFVLPVRDVDIVPSERQNAVCVGRLAVTVEEHPVPIDGDERLAFGRGEKPREEAQQAIGTKSRNSVEG